MLSHFLKTLLGDGWVPVLGAIIIGLFTNRISELVKPSIATEIALTIGILMIAYFAYRNNKGKGSLVIDEGKNLSKTPHVISGLSFLNWPINQEDAKDKPSNIRLVLNLIEKHQPTLKYLHLVLSKSSGVIDSQSELSKWLEQQQIKPEELIKDIPIVDGYDMGEVFQAVNNHLKELAKEGIDLRTQVLIDVTAGTAAISAGLTMAALSNGCNITYQATNRMDGDKLTGTTKWQFYKNRIVQIWESFPQS